MVINLNLFHTFFSEMNIFFRVIMFYVVIALILFLIIILMTASSVSIETNKSYKLLIKLIVNNQKTRLRTGNKIKVLI